MSNVRMIGVSNTVKMADVQDMGGPARQDQFITEAADYLLRNLREYVKDARPVGDFAFQVTGPHDDPLQGLIYVHTLAAPFDVDRLPADSGAWRAWADGDQTDRETITLTLEASDD